MFKGQLFFFKRVSIVKVRLLLTVAARDERLQGKGKPY